MTHLSPALSLIQPTGWFWKISKLDENENFRLFVSFMAFLISHKDHPWPDATHQSKRKTIKERIWKKEFYFESIKIKLKSSLTLHCTIFTFLKSTFSVYYQETCIYLMSCQYFFSNYAFIFQSVSHTTNRAFLYNVEELRWIVEIALIFLITQDVF